MRWKRPDLVIGTGFPVLTFQRFPAAGERRIGSMALP